MSLAKLTRYLFLGVSILGIAIVSVFLFTFFRPLDSLGEANDNCARQDFPSVSNDSGLVATAHLADCTYGLAHGSETTFVYVHKPEDKDSADSLVFRFDNLGNQDKPQIMWDGKSNLHIAISEVGEVTKQVDSILTTRITYSIGKIDVSHEEYTKLTRRYEEILFAALFLLVSICALTMRSIREVTRRNA